MNEDFLHYVWKFGLFDTKNLTTTTGQALQILQKGMHNLHSGPDFSNARIQLDDTLWAGNIEIHIRSSDWFRHNHQHDASYANIILHVVFDDDKPIAQANGIPVPTLVLKDRLDPTVWDKYQRFIENKTWIPCANQVKQVDEFIVSNWLERMTIERLARKSDAVLALLEKNTGSWNETFYQLLAQNFGFKTNAEPFLLLAQHLPESILAKQKASPIQIEALLFGVAGFLNEEFVDEYPNTLKQEFNFLQAKYSLTSLPKHIWKFARMRPENFPTVRIAQFAALVLKSQGLFSQVLGISRTDALVGLFNVEANPYFAAHYTFDKATPPKPKRLGQSSIDNILINTVAVTLFAYGINQNNQAYKLRALTLLNHVKPEDNTITQNWALVGVKAQSAQQSQGLIELKNLYCEAKKCLLCSIGISLLKTQ